MTVETIELDWRGLRCPEPVLNTARQIRKLSKDGKPRRVRVLADDASFPLDIEGWCRNAANVSFDTVREDQGTFEAVIWLGDRDAAPAPAPAAAFDDLPVSASSARSVSRSLPPIAASAPSGPATLDCRGMCCPEPILKLARAYRKMDPGAALEILADDPAFGPDLEGWARNAAADVELLERDGDAWRAMIRRPGASAQEAPAPQPARPAPVSPKPITAQHDFAEAPHTPAPQPIPNLSAQVAPTPQPVAPAPQPVIAAPQPVAPAPIGPKPDITLALDDVPEAQRMGRLEAFGGSAWTGSLLEVRTSNAALLQRALAFAVEHAHTVEHMDSPGGVLRLRLSGAEVKAAAPVAQALVPAPEVKKKRASLLVIHNDFEGLMAAMMIANAAASQDMETEIFFSFWGVNLLRADQPRADMPKPKLSILQRMFRWMMPKGPKRQQLGKMSFGGMGTAMMLKAMSDQNVMGLTSLMQTAQEMDVKFVVCTMSMNIMGIHERDLVQLPNMSMAGVSAFVANTAGSDLHMVF